MNCKEFIFPACMIVLILSIPLGIVLWVNHVLEM